MRRAAVHAILCVANMLDIGSAGAALLLLPRCCQHQRRGDDLDRAAVPVATRHV